MIENLDAVTEWTHEKCYGLYSYIIIY